MRFKFENSFDERKSEAIRVLTKYPDRIPIICEKSDSCKVDEIDKKKYLVPRVLTMGQFIYVIRKRLNLKPEQAIFLFTNGKIMSSSSVLEEIYHKEKDEDGFLYFLYSEENVFG